MVASKNNMYFLLDFSLATCGCLLPFIAQVRPGGCRLLAYIWSAAFIRALRMYRRSRSRSPALGLLPHDELRFAELEERILTLERWCKNEVTALKKEIAGWKYWEHYLCRVYQWAVNVATIFSRFPWDWAHTARASTSHGDAGDIV